MQGARRQDVHRGESRPVLGVRNPHLTTGGGAHPGDRRLDDKRRTLRVKTTNELSRLKSQKRLGAPFINTARTRLINRRNASQRKPVHEKRAPHTQSTRCTTDQKQTGRLANSRHKALHEPVIVAFGASALRSEGRQEHGIHPATRAWHAAQSPHIASCPTHEHRGQRSRQATSHHVSTSGNCEAISPVTLFRTLAAPSWFGPTARVGGHHISYLLFEIGSLFVAIGKHHMALAIRQFNWSRLFSLSPPLAGLPRPDLLFRAIALTRLCGHPFLAGRTQKSRHPEPLRTRVRARHKGSCALIPYKLRQSLYRSTKR